MVIGLTMIFGAVPALARDIFVSPTGDDSASGLEATRPVATLQRAMRIGSSLKPADEPIRILVSPGTYRGQSLSLRDRDLTRKIVISGTEASATRFPIFSGDGTESTWLTILASSGKPTNLTIRKLQIDSYQTAISISGNRDDPARFNSGTVIEHNVFSRIGSIASGVTSPSTAAIRLVNSRDNLIRSNSFQTIRNRKKCGMLHSLYLAHRSSGNVIEDNKFRDMCGSAIKLRDRSNDNLIAGNSFSDLRKAPAIEEWFCDMSRRNDCTKKAGECPSTGNLIRQNSFHGIKASRHYAIRGGERARSWCDAGDFSRRRIIRASPVG